MLRSIYIHASQHFCDDHLASQYLCYPNIPGKIASPCNTLAKFNFVIPLRILFDSNPNIKIVFKKLKFNRRARCLRITTQFATQQIKNIFSRKFVNTIKFMLFICIIKLIANINNNKITYK